LGPITAVNVPSAIRALLFLLESAATNEALPWPQELIRYGAQILSRVNLDVALENIPSD
jgi:hypothetical protein